MSAFRKFAVVLLLGLAFMSTARADESQDAMEQGTQFFAMGNYEMAIMQYRFALSWPGAHVATAHFNIGVCQHRLGRISAAVDEYRAALKSDKNRYFKAAYALGIALEDLREWEQSKDAFALAVEISHERDAESLFQLARLLAREGERETATEYLRKAIKNAPNNFPGGHNNLGVLLALSGQYNEALNEFDLAVQQSAGKSREAQYNLQLCRNLLRAPSATLLASLQSTKQTQ